MKKYPAYKPSEVEWIGDVPEHWEVKKLKYIAAINPSKGNNSIDFTSEEMVTFLAIENISEEGKFDYGQKKSINTLASGYIYFEKTTSLSPKLPPASKIAFSSNSSHYTSFHGAFPDV